MKRGMPILLLCLLLLSGCGAAPADAEGGGPSGEPESARETEAEREAAPETENLFASIPGSYLFCSGVGGWSTTLTVEADGSFAGKFHDSDMGAADPERFPGGTRYVCGFSGKFTQPVKVEDTVWSMELESMDLEDPADGSEEFADGVRYVYSGPYGLEEAEELLIFLPDAGAEDLPEGALRAAWGPFDWEPTPEGTVGLYIIYNVNEGYGFVEYPRITGRS